MPESDARSVHAFVTLLRTAAETATREVHKLLGTGGVPISLTIVVLAVAGGLFGLYGSERADYELFISTYSLPFPISPSLISLMVSVYVKHQANYIHWKHQANRFF